MKLINLILFILISINSFAHKDKHLSENYGNVQVYLRTGFENSEFEKIKVIGKLSEKIAQRLKYKDTILIEYIQDYTDKYTDDLYILEYNNSNYKILGGIKSEYDVKPDKKGLAVSIYSDRINVTNVLKLVEFAISNKEKTNTYLKEKSIGYKVEEDEVLLKPLKTIATDDKIIEEIFFSESEIVNEIINNKIDISTQNLYGMELYWQNDKFIFANNHIRSNEREIVFEIKDFYHHKMINTYDAIVYTDKFDFYFLDGTKVNEKCTLDLDMPVYGTIMVKSYGNKLIFASGWNPSSINIYLIDKNKVISKFE